MTSTPPVPQHRAARAVVFATVCTVLAAVAHASASAVPVPPGTLLGGFAGAVLVAYALAGHERSLPVIGGVLLGGQFALHSLYAGASPDLLGHHPALAPAHHAGGSWMTAAHAGAACVSAWWLRRGERAAWSLARRALFRPLLPLRVVLPVPPAVALPVYSVPVRPIGLLLRHDVARRGPPFRSSS
ncbi:hypothetical protein [Actinomadura flavalba]|uniref:hypothetical protein n=1 Tax=Actinomadura flavalba TaxID=1120938 RepID=UPI000374774A|nr:hypothetical protein [Actinomadura flavalba]